MSAKAAPRLEPVWHKVIIIGGGQAGLSLSWHMTQAGTDHVVLERAVAFNAWKHERWDSFHLVTPNWQCRLPGYEYLGNDPSGFMQKPEIVRFVDGFKESFNPPLIEGVEVTQLYPQDGHFVLRTNAGPFMAEHVCIATGGYHRPIRPLMAERLPPRIMQLHATEYKNPAELPEGAVLVVGSGQSGCEIAEDLRMAGRDVHLSVGSAPRMSRFYRGRDIADWLHDMGHDDLPAIHHPAQDHSGGRADHYVTGRDGGRDIDLRKLALGGLHLHGHLTAVEGGRIGFAHDLRRSLDEADRANQTIKDGIDRFIHERQIAVPTEGRYAPLWQPPEQDPPLDLMAAEIGTVIWCVGYQTDFTWVHAPVFTGRGVPSHQRGITALPGLYFLGLPWLYSWGSGRFAGVARDAAFIAAHIAQSAKRSALGKTMGDAGGAREKPWLS